jgi:hypothetical protein
MSAGQGFPEPQFSFDLLVIDCTMIACLMIKVALLCIHGPMALDNFLFTGQHGFVQQAD